jgi:small-conductance mechanosensitive channel
VRRVLLRVAAAHGLILKKPEPDVRFKAFSDNSLDFELVFMVAEPRGIGRVKSDVNFAIDAAFKAEGIEIPFPQRDVRLIQKEPILHRIVQESSPVDE